MLPESDLSQSSAAGCGTKRIRIRAGLCVRLVWTVRGKYNRSTTTNRRFSFTSCPPIPLPHHHLLLFTPRQKLRISANSPLVDIHGPHQGKNNNHPSLNIPSAYLFPRYLPANRPQVDWRWGIPHHLKFPYKEILTRHIQAKPPVSNSQPRPLARLLPPYVSVFTCLLVVAVVVIAVVTAMLSPLWSRADG